MSVSLHPQVSDSAALERRPLALARGSELAFGRRHRRRLLLEVSSVLALKAVLMWAL